MKAGHAAIVVLSFSVQVLVPAIASARQAEERPAIPSFEMPVEAATVAAQGTPTQRSSSTGGKLLRNALIGAAVGAAVVGVVARGAGDCGDCSGDTVKAIASGAMYGALIGAAIRLSPAKRPTPGQPSRKTTLRPGVNPIVTKKTKALNVVFQF